MEELSILWDHVFWLVDKARAELGYRPQYNFTEFCTALKAGDEAHYPFANLPWWGTDQKQ